MNAKLSSDTRSSENNPVSAKEVNERYRLMMDLSGDGIMVVQDGIIKESNSSMVRLCGCHPESMLDSAIAEFFPFDENPEIEALAGSIGSKANKVPTQTATLVCKTGRRLKVEIKAAGCAFEKKPAILWVIRDISDRLTARESLENAGKLDAIAALSGGIAHDYNNLLTAIIGNITLAQTHLNAKEKPFRLLDHALVASKTAKNLTQKLITFSKGGSPNKEIAAVDRLVRSATDFTLSGSNIKCNYTFPAGIHLIDVDQSQIGQAIHNVIMNAREAMHAGGIIDVAAANVFVTDEVPTLMEGDYVKISVSDQGTGIPADEFDKVFEPYYSTKKRGNARGTGLGLSICRSIIRKNGGDVTVASQMGVGTTIHLYLPAVDPKALHKISSEKKPHEQPPIFGEGKILVMDDDPMIRELAGEILWHLGYEVEFATDGREAIAIYQKSMKSTRPFDAVILDLTVRGGMGGKDAIQKLIAIDPEVKSIVSSGYSDDPGMTDFKQYGFSGVVAKPYTLAELGEKLNQVLKR
jgi:PAS domain S-box-containing protein